MGGWDRVQRWFKENDWTSFPFQEEVWSRYLAGESGLIHSATGTGKTLAAWLGPVMESLDHPADGLNVIWVTPLRALAADTKAALQHPLVDLETGLTVAMRTGDTATAERQRIRKSAPFGLVTTPESLSLMLGQPDSTEQLASVRSVIVDEWHELMASKRGVQVELGLARLRRIQPDLRVWGVSATLGNLEDAARTLVGYTGKAHIVEGFTGKEIRIESILPDTMHRFPWAGHFGTQMIPKVAEAIEQCTSCLIFTNTRAMAEIWFQQLKDAVPDWADRIGLHHGSLDREVRDAAEEGLKSGALKAVVCTSSLDLGVDFTPVDTVVQVGSPKGVARLLQRAGRSGHRPGVPSTVLCVPTHAFELVDIASARTAAENGRIESRPGVRKPLDVLAQHLVTIACGPGFSADSMYAEVKDSVAFSELTPDEWEWCLDFIVRGGDSLRAYPEFHRVVIDSDGLYRVTDREIAHRHRMSIGTIVSDAALKVQYVNGGSLGTVEESFVSRLRPGDRFLFAGRVLEFVRLRDMTAWVRKGKSLVGAVPRWGGGRLPLSSELSAAIRETLDRARDGDLYSPELKLLAPILELQSRWSSIPRADELLVEQVESREGHHLFIYPFEGRLVHEGLAALFAYRIAQLRPITFTIACNDYGFELLASEPIPFEEAIRSNLFSSAKLAEDIVNSLNSVEMAKRQFREVARISGLIFQGFPGSGKSAKQLQSSSGLFFDVFNRFDPSNRLLEQSYREVLERQLEESRLARALVRLQESKLLVEHPERPTPMSFPILVDRLRETVTTESVSDRIERIVAELEKAAGD
jgi:ATP-dependent Lhr-like helicase